MSYTEGTPSPQIFRLWSAIGAVAGALERRTWVISLDDPIYPNMYILLVGKPGSGKTEGIKRVRKMFDKVKKFHLAAHSNTRASLVDALSESKQLRQVKDTLVEYHSIIVCVDEFSNFMPSYDLDMLGLITRLYDNPDSQEERRRHAKVQLKSIIRPTLHFLAGVQPAFMASLMPQAAFDMGFPSRLIMLYSGEKIRKDPFGHTNYSSVMEDRLVEGLRDLSELYGEFQYTQETKAAISAWVASDMPPIPNHTKLQAYNERRILHVQKLCIVSAASRGQGMIIELSDYHRALGWLIEAEAKMPDIFRAMLGQSDADLLRELHFYAQQKYFESKKQPLLEEILIGFLVHKAPQHTIFNVLELGVRGGLFSRQKMGDQNYYIPRAMNGAWDHI